MGLMLARIPNRCCCAFGVLTGILPVDILLGRVTNDYAVFYCDCACLEANQVTVVPNMKFRYGPLVMLLIFYRPVQYDQLIIPDSPVSFWIKNNRTCVFSCIVYTGNNQVSFIRKPFIIAQ